MLFSHKAIVTTLFVSQAFGCLHFNATLEDNSLSVYSWDDANNNNATNKEDIICKGHDLKPVASCQWSVPCTFADNSKSDTIFDVFLDPNNKRFLDVIYQYTNPLAANLQAGDDVFLFNFRVASVDGKKFKGREFCAQYDITRLIKPEALKNPCDSLDTC